MVPRVRVGHARAVGPPEQGRRVYRRGPAVPPTGVPAAIADGPGVAMAVTAVGGPRATLW